MSYTTSRRNLLGWLVDERKRPEPDPVGEFARFAFGADSWQPQWRTEAQLDRWVRSETKGDPERCARLLAAIPKVLEAYNRSLQQPLPAAPPKPRAPSFFPPKRKRAARS